MYLSIGATLFGMGRGGRSRNRPQGDREADIMSVVKGATLAERVTMEKDRRLKSGKVAHRRALRNAGDAAAFAIAGAVDPAEYFGRKAETAMRSEEKAKGDAAMLERAERIAGSLTPPKADLRRITAHAEAMRIVRALPAEERIGLSPTITGILGDGDYNLILSAVRERVEGHKADIAAEKAADTLTRAATKSERAGRPAPKAPKTPAVAVTA